MVNKIDVVFYNLHGIMDLIKPKLYSVHYVHSMVLFVLLIVQEHSLAIFDLDRLNMPTTSSNMFCFAFSAMGDVIGRDCLHGRPLDV